MRAGSLEPERKKNYSGDPQPLHSATHLYEHTINTHSVFFWFFFDIGSMTAVHEVVKSEVGCCGRGI